MALIPTWPFVAGALVVGFVGGWAMNGWRLNSDIQESRAARAETVVGAVAQRITENKADEVKQSTINQKIEAKKNEELTPVVKRIDSAPRLRVGAGICPGVVARASETKSTGSSNGEDTGGRLVREDIDRDFRALKKQVEEALATGRSCQKFVKDNGLAP